MLLPGMDQELIQIGRTGKAHGLKGEIKLSIEEIYWDDLDYLDVFFLSNKSGKQLPFFLESLRGSGIAKFEDVDDRESAILIQHQGLWVRKSDFKRDLETEPETSDLEFSYLIGFIASDQNLGTLGAILDVEAFPQQEMLVISLEGEEKLIPANEHLFLNIDKKKKTVLFDLPEGLLDL